MIVESKLLFIPGQSLKGIHMHNTPHEVMGLIQMASDDIQYKYKECHFII